MKKVVYVLGQDIASISSGLNLVMGEFTGNDIKFKSLAEKSFTIENTFKSRYKNAEGVFDFTWAMNEKYNGVDLIVNEDYINSMSHVAFSLGEFNGIIRAFHYKRKFSMLLNNPAKFRSFIANGRKAPKGGAAKRLIVEWVKKEFKYESTRHYVKERSDCTDAFIHGVIGAYYCFFLMGVSMDILSPIRKKIFINSKTKNGLMDNKDLLLNEDVLYSLLEVKKND